MSFLESRQMLWLQLIFAGLLAISAWWLSRGWLAEEHAELKAALFADSGQRVNIIVASQNLEPGDVLNVDKLAAALVDPQFLPEDIISTEDFSQIDGFRLKTGIVRGKPLLFSYLQPAVSDFFSELVGPGQRAITLDVDSLSSIEGMISVGDHIDLLLREKNGQENSLVILAENVPVIATGSLRRASQQNLAVVQEAEVAQLGYRSLTIVLDAALAARALMARESRSLVYLLRGRGDQSPLPFQTLLDSGEAGSNVIPVFTGTRQKDGQLTPAFLRKPQ